MFGWTVPIVLALAGFCGGWWIRRHLTGSRRIGVWLFFLCLPFVILFGVLVSQMDPTLSAERNSNNLAFGFVLYSIVMAIPWFASIAIGAIIAKPKPEMKPKPVALKRESQGQQPAEPEPDDGLPHWKHPDRPLLDPPQLAHLLRDMASRHGIDPELLPSFSPPFAGDGDYVFREKFDYNYVRMKDGKALFEHSSAVADQLLYDVFAELSRSCARSSDSGTEASRQDRAEFLAAIDPRWARYFLKVEGFSTA